MTSYPAHYLEDLAEGQTVESVGRTITEADVANYAGVSGDYTQLHTNAERTADTEFGERIVHGPLTFACTTGLFLRTGILEGSIRAFLGVEEMTLPRPVYVGDTISVTAEVAETRPLDSRGDAGLVIFDSVTRNQNAEPVLETDMRFLVGRKDSCDSDPHVDQPASGGGDP